MMIRSQAQDVVRLDKFAGLSESLPVSNLAQTTLFGASPARNHPQTTLYWASPVRNLAPTTLFGPVLPGFVPQTTLPGPLWPARMRNARLIYSQLPVYQRFTTIILTPETQDRLPVKKGSAACRIAAFRIPLPAPN